MNFKQQEQLGRLLYTSGLQNNSITQHNQQMGSALLGPFFVSTGFVWGTGNTRAEAGAAR